MSVEKAKEWIERTKIKLKCMEIRNSKSQRLNDIDDAEKFLDEALEELEEERQEKNSQPIAELSFPS